MRPNSLILIIEDNKILLQKGQDSVSGLEFYRPLGGGIEFGETSKETAVREIKEEIGATLINENFLKVIENIFDFDGKKFHEITFLYKGEILEKELFTKDRVPIIDKENKYAEWVSISDIKSKKFKIFPEESLNFI